MHREEICKKCVKTNWKSSKDKGREKERATDLKKMVCDESRQMQLAKTLTDIGNNSDEYSDWCFADRAS